MQRRMPQPRKEHKRQHICNNSLITTMHPQRVMLKDLPQDLYYRIFSFLSNEGRNPPLRISLDLADMITAPLPQALLPIAKTSRSLQELIGKFLGPRAVYLSTECARQDLHEWIMALAPFVKAISTHDTLIECRENFRYLQTTEDKICRMQSSDSMRILKSIWYGIPNLEVLDIRNVPFDECHDFVDDLLHGLVGVLEAHSGSLRELAVPITESCAVAFEMIWMKKLEVVELEARVEKRFGRRWGTSLIWKSCMMTETLQRILLALDTHVEKQKVGLQEVRLRKFGKDLDNTSSMFKGVRAPKWFEMIKRIRLDTVRLDGNEIENVLKMLSMFENLEYFHWSGEYIVRREYLEMMNNSWSCLNGLYICPCKKNWTFNIEGEVTCGAKLFKIYNPSTDIVLKTSLHKMKSLNIQETLCKETMKIIGECSPGLEEVELRIVGGNIKGLKHVLEKCRGIRKLRLMIEQVNMEYDRWEELGMAVTEGCEILEDIRIIECHQKRLKGELISFVTETMKRILSWLGERARVFVFEIWVDCGRDVILECVCDILQICLECKGILWIECNFLGRRWLSSPPLITDGIGFGRFLELKKQIFKELEKLYRFKVGNLDRGTLFSNDSRY